MSDYTPSTDEVRENYTDGRYDPYDNTRSYGDGVREFDRWLNAKLAAVWDETCAALGWALAEGPPYEALGYVATHNPYRPEATS